MDVGGLVGQAVRAMKTLPAPGQSAAVPRWLYE